MTRLKRNIVSIALCALLTAGIAAGFRAIPILTDFVESFQGYDYESASKNADWKGPGRGEMIDLGFFVNEDGKALSQVTHQRPLVLTVVDPECGACRRSKDQIETLGKNLLNSDVGHVVVSFSQKLSAKELSDYVSELGAASEAFVWVKGDEEIPMSIKNMVIPSHILVTSDGNVLRAFPGTSNERKIRDRMVRQILADSIRERAMLEPVH